MGGVILFNEQMRQQDDMEYCALLRRIRAGTTIIYPKHARRPMDTKRIKLLCARTSFGSIYEFARSRNQPLFILVAAHHCIDASVKVDDWRSLAVVDHGSNFPGPSLFIFTKYMPFIRLSGSKKRPLWILRLMNQPMLTRLAITQ